MRVSGRELSLALLCVLLLEPFVAVTAAPLVDPSKPGPFPAGVTRTLLVDHKRTDALTGKPRTLVTEIWYPAEDQARKRPKTRFTDFIPIPVNDDIEAVFQKVYKRSADQLNERYDNHSVRDARVRDGRFPLIVFSHGNGGTRNQNTFWCDHLASHGYIIVSADHTGNCSFCIIDGQVIPHDGEQRKASAQDRPKDMSFLLDQMIRWDRGADSRFAGKIDTDHAAATGMSFGAYTTVNVIEQDSRFKAIIPMSGAWAATHENTTTPALLMLGQEDRTIGPIGNTAIRKYHTENTGPSYLLEFINGGHYTFTDMFKINPQFGDGVGKGQRGGDGEAFDYTSMQRSYEIINAYSTAFCGLYLKGRAGYRDYLTGNHWPKDIKLDAK